MEDRAVDTELGRLAGGDERLRAVMIASLARRLTARQWEVFGERLVVVAFAPPGAPDRPDLLALLARFPIPSAIDALRLIAADEGDPEHEFAARLFADPPDPFVPVDAPSRPDGPQWHLHRGEENPSRAAAPPPAAAAPQAAAAPPTIALPSPAPSSPPMGGSLWRRLRDRLPTLSARPAAPRPSLRQAPTTARKTATTTRSAAKAAATKAVPPPPHPHHGVPPLSAADDGLEAREPSAGSAAHAPAPAPAPAPVPAQTADAPDVAYPRLDAPAEVAPGELFVVAVGFRADADPDVVVQAPVDVPELDVPFRVTLGFDPRAFALVGAAEAGAELHRTTADSWPEVSFRLVALGDGLGPRALWVSYHRGGGLVGMVTRVVVVRPEPLAAGPQPAPVPAAATFAGLAGPSAAPAPAPAPALVPAPVPVGPAGADPDPPDLYLVIRSAPDDGGRRRFLFTAHSRHADVPDTEAPVDEVVVGERVLGDRPEQLGQAIRVKVATGGTPRLVYTELRGAGQNVFRSVPPPVREALRRVAARSTPERPATVLLYSDDPYYPWELAVDPDGWPSHVGTASPFLGAHVAISRWLLSDEPPPPPTPGTTAGLEIGPVALVTAHYEGVTAWPLLPEAEQEVRDLAALFGADATVVDPTVDAFLDVLGGVPPVDLVHVALHGKYDAQGLQTGLVLLRTERDARAGTERRVPEIVSDTVVAAYELPRRAFVYLNACQTAAGDDAVFGTYGGLAAAFTKAGAGGVVAPLWNVDDTTASTVAARFYAQTLGPGAPSVAEVLRRIRADYTEEAVRARAPGVDATLVAFQLFGHPRMHLTRTEQTRTEQTRTEQTRTSQGDDHA